MNETEKAAFMKTLQALTEVIQSFDNRLAALEVVQHFMVYHLRVCDQEAARALSGALKSRLSPRVEAGSYAASCVAHLIKLANGELDAPKGLEELRAPEPDLPAWLKAIIEGGKRET